MEQRKIKIKLDTAEKIKKFLQVTRGFMSDVDIMTDRAIQPELSFKTVNHLQVLLKNLVVLRLN